MKLIPKKILKNHLANYYQSLIYPKTIQKKLLKSILKENKKTFYGKKYDFSSIKTIEEYQEKVPIITYEDIIEEIKRMRNGEQNVLCKQKVIYFATTSGTTSEIKTIPVTKERTKQLNQELVLWMFFVLNKFKNLLNGKLLYFAGPPFEGMTEGGIVQGSISGYMATQRPWFAKQKIVVPPEVYNELNVDKKTKIISKLALQTKNISQIGFFAPIEAILFFEYIKNNREDLIEGIRHIKPKRAKELEKIKEFVPAKIWPKLKLINCIKSESQMPYINKLKELIAKKDIIVRDPGIYASEGRISLGITKHNRAGIIVATENFFEFAELKKDGSFKKPTTIDKISKGKKYKIIFTTKEGLYRYDLGDIIKVVDFKRKLPIIQFQTRDNFMNITGELAPERQLIASIKEAEKKTKIKIKQYMYTPSISDPKKKPHYNILVETENTINEKKAKGLIIEIDKQLQKHINDYKQMRNEFGRMGHPKLSIIQKNGFHKFDKKRIGNSGQPKPIIISKKENIIKEFKIEQEITIKEK